MRERFLLDPNWRFALGHAANPAIDFDYVRDRSLVKAGEARGAAGHSFDDSKWRLIDLPHDFAIEQPFDPRGDKELCEHGFYSVGPDHPESSVGWYRKTFDIAAKERGRRISVQFDGVFRDSVVWFNGHRIGRHASGYTGFQYDVTDVVNYGGKNVLVVRADATHYEGWFYEGAGIYRHAWLEMTSPCHIARHGVVVRSDVTDDGAAVTIITTLVNESDDAITVDLRSDVRGPNGKRCGDARDTVTIEPWQQREVSQVVNVPEPQLWSCESPSLYTVKSDVRRGSKSIDTLQTTFGIRTFRWDAKRGFFLNEQPLKIKGTCNHRDYVGVGVASHDRMHVARLEKLKELGSNAFRCSHYAVSPELLDACDRMGILVLAENRLAGSSPEVLSQLSELVRRDRNHPSIFLWSLANEEHSVQWKEAGERIGRTMMRTIRTLDPTRAITTAMHDRGLGEGFASVVDVHGWNYIHVGDIEAFHKRRPAQPILGTEEGSTVCTRGVYEDDAARGYVSAYDKRAPKWGATAETWWTYFAQRDWIAGGFVWTGFDHRGEPIPYKWPCTLSHFGLMDLCGFPKDNYYYYRAWWRDEPLLHLFPHWNWAGKEGREIDVRVFCNLEHVELFVNGISQGIRPIARNSHAAWKVLYEPGVIEAHGYRDGKRVLIAKRETTGTPATIELVPDRKVIDADGADLSLVTVQVRDAEGRLVPTAMDLITFEITGPGRLIGVGNGDPSSHASEKAPFRHLFNGLAMAVVQSTRKPGTITLTARSPGLKDATCRIKSVACEHHPTIQ